MTLGGSYYGGGRRRGRTPLAQRIVGWVLTLTLIGLAGLYAWRTGSALATKELDVLKTDMAVLTEDHERLKLEKAGLEQALEEEQRHGLELFDRYQRDVPDESSMQLLMLLRNRLDAGVPSDRIEEIITTAAPEWRCEDELVTRRFVLQTATTSGANDSVGFAKGFLTVTGTGVSELSPDGNPEAWFDAAQPVTIFFTHLGGERTEVTGTLPLHHSVVVGQDIQRFTIVAGERSFVNVTSVACAYP